MHTEDWGTPLVENKSHTLDDDIVGMALATGGTVGW